MTKAVLTQPDTESSDILLAHVRLERKHARPIYEQLRTAIEFAIFSGTIPEGSALPSVRRLAELLDIAPNTVVRAYRDLEQGGWISAAPKRGYFVSLGVDDGDGLAEGRAAEVARLIDHAVHAARKANIDSATFLRMVAEREKALRNAPLYVAVLGYQEAFLDERVAVIASELIGLPGVQVVGISYQDLETKDPSQIPHLDDVEWFLVPVGEVREATRLLGPRAGGIIPMTRTLRADVRDFIARQPEATRFGVLAGRREHIGRMLAALRNMHPLAIPPLYASTQSPADVQKVVAGADVLLIGTRARPFFAQYGPLPKPSIEFVYIPDEKTIRRLRARLAAELRDQRQLERVSGSQ